MESLIQSVFISCYKPYQTKECTCHHCDKFKFYVDAYTEHDPLISSLLAKILYFELEAAIDCYHYEWGDELDADYYLSVTIPKSLKFFKSTLEDLFLIDGFLNLLEPNEIPIRGINIKTEDEDKFDA